jgi:hypothetical protein
MENQLVTHLDLTLNVNRKAILKIPKFKNLRIYNLTMIIHLIL